MRRPRPGPRARSGRRPAPPASGSSPATPRSSGGARATRSTSTPPGVGRSIARPRPGRIRRGRQDHPHRDARRPQPGRDARPRGVRPEARTSGATARRSSFCCRSGRRARCGCATSPAAAWRPSSPSWPNGSPIPFLSKRIRSPCRGPSGRRASSSGSTLSTWPAKGKAVVIAPAAKAGEILRRMRGHPAGPQGRRHRRGPGPHRPARRAPAPDDGRRPAPPRAPDLRAPPPHLLKEGQITVPVLLRLTGKQPREAVTREV